MTSGAGDFAAGHAVVIGVANYWHVASLPEAVRNDARDVASILTSSAHCGYESRNVHLLLDEGATLPRIRTALDSLAEVSGTADSVVVFFSGHGGIVGAGPNRESALLPVDFDTSTRDTTCLSESEFSSVLQRIPARRLLVVIDACHSGGAGTFKGYEMEESVTFGYSEKALGRLAQGVGRVVIASSRADETSLILENGHNSVFTSMLLEALRGKAEGRGDGVIRVFEIFNYVSQMVKLAVPGRQHPIFKTSDLEDNFPVTLDRGGLKAVVPECASGPLSGDWRQLEDLMADLYPTGPMEQEIWARAGGDPSRLHLSGTGRVAWFKALYTLRRGGGGANILRESLIRVALEDYPHHPVLAALL